MTTKTETMAKPTWPKLLEKLAALQHEQWSGWMGYLFTKGALNQDGSFTIFADSVDRWHRQAITKYKDLPENEKESDQKEAARYKPIIIELLAGARREFAERLKEKFQFPDNSTTKVSVKTVEEDVRNITDDLLAAFEKEGK
jgi:hypothetical protein